MLLKVAWIFDKRNEKNRKRNCITVSLTVLQARISKTLLLPISLLTHVVLTATTDLSILNYMFKTGTRLH